MAYGISCIQKPNIAYITDWLMNVTIMMLIIEWRASASVYLCTNFGGIVNITNSLKTKLSGKFLGYVDLTSRVTTVKVYSCMYLSFNSCYLQNNKRFE